MICLRDGELRQRGRALRKVGYDMRGVDWLIVGAGMTGAVVAERIASQLEQSVLVIDRRPHIGGNAYDHPDHGMLVHQYGPHIFHTNSERVWTYLSRFTEWRPYFHHVPGLIDGRLVPVPFNLNSILALFPPRMADNLCDALVQRYGFGSRVPVLRLREQEGGDLRFLADYVYTRVFEGYTLKQWGMRPDELSPSVTARVPILVSRDDRYFQDRYQAMPRGGYTAMFNRVLDNPRIRVELGVDFQDAVVAAPNARVVFTGPIDEFFKYVYGPCPTEACVSSGAMGSTNPANRSGRSTIPMSSISPVSPTSAIERMPKPRANSYHRVSAALHAWPQRTLLPDTERVVVRRARALSDGSGRLDGKSLLRWTVGRLRLLQHGSGLRACTHLVRKADCPARNRCIAQESPHFCCLGYRRRSATFGGTLPSSLLGWSAADQGGKQIGGRSRFHWRVLSGASAGAVRFSVRCRIRDHSHALHDAYGGDVL